MHPENPHKQPYDFPALVKVNSDLENHVFRNKYGNLTIDFSNSEAVLYLNKALLHYHYQVENWDIPKGFLCPPIPGRMDYLLHLKDFLDQKIGKKRYAGIDIGVGASCIYPILAAKHMGWNMIGSDIEMRSIEAAEQNVLNNKLASQIKIRLQKDRGSILKNVIREDDSLDFSMCNPPFHDSAEEANKANFRKNSNLGIDTRKLNFGGRSNELWCRGGEALFLKRMIRDSQKVEGKVQWFTSLVSKQQNLPAIEKHLKKLGADYDIIPMQLGNKKSRFIAWKF
ncbi:23S rRNA (adenine(1618)-N(6))-methyltransferase RlmF [Christiangramia portivictoriae]|uniref:23S rRNA (adenine(1618)-N(6))-methyltransferase RlmF n=1 Tax=Christiangramia portivictoriae TaxID=326069 RepID=UPI0003F6F331|nr:23S rRNA (adenine(1618)-N(6))-methyltransferase RlmF [Christiangramia portivictoriae]